jgi:hypothetical protein
LKINSSQSIASFISKAFPHPIEAKITGESEIDDDNPLSKVSSSCISIGRGAAKDLLISFQRTIRVPEGKHSSNLPPGLGAFPLFNIQPFSHQLPISMVSQGGLFFPIYRKNHLLINNSN